MAAIMPRDRRADDRAGTTAPYSRPRWHWPPWRPRRRDRVGSHMTLTRTRPLAMACTCGG